HLKRRAELLVSAMDHHSNIFPWQLICEERGARLTVIPMNRRGELLLDEYEKLLGPRTKIVAVVHVSNSLGTINPIREMVRLAHAKGIPVLVDGSQAAPHLPIDVQALGCDFYAITGHKLFGPTGTGVLWARRELLDSMPPFFGGGEMIRTVSFDGTTFADVPHKFEAGTPNIAGFIGLGAAIDYVTELGLDRIGAAEHALRDYTNAAPKSVPGLRLFGAA